jgi:hypothetical protein
MEDPKDGRVKCSLCSVYYYFWSDNLEDSVCEECYQKYLCDLCGNQTYECSCYHLSHKSCNICDSMLIKKKTYNICPRCFKFEENMSVCGLCGEIVPIECLYNNRCTSWCGY